MTGLASSCGSGGQCLSLVCVRECVGLVCVAAGGSTWVCACVFGGGVDAQGSALTQLVL
jgi:hypothetical protein